MNNGPVSYVLKKIPVSDIRKHIGSVIDAPTYNIHFGNGYVAIEEGPCYNIFKVQQVGDTVSLVLEHWFSSEINADIFHLVGSHSPDKFMYDTDQEYSELYPSNRIIYNMYTEPVICIDGQNYTICRKGLNIRSINGSGSHYIEGDFYTSQCTVDRFVYNSQTYSLMAADGVVELYMAKIRDDDAVKEKVETIYRSPDVRQGMYCMLECSDFENFVKVETTHGFNIYLCIDTYCIRYTMVPNLHCMTHSTNYIKFRKFNRSTMRGWLSYDSTYLGEHNIEYVDLWCWSVSTMFNRVHLPYSDVYASC